MSAKISVCAALVAALSVASCSSAGTKLMKKAAVESRQALGAGDFQKAIDVYREAFKRNPRYKGLAVGYAGTVEGIYLAADRALGRRDYALAGTIYRILLDNVPGFKVIAASLTFDTKGLEAGLRYCRIAQVDGQARQDVKAGNWAKALSFYPSVFKEYPGDGELAARYARTLQDIKAAGDKAMTEKDFSHAGQVYALLVKELPVIEERQAPVTFTRTDLLDLLGLCRDSLTKEGLAEYRKGNLAGAIAVWQSLLAFDPDNVEVKKAVETAKTQLNGIIKKKRAFSVTR